MADDIDRKMTKMLSEIDQRVSVEWAMDCAEHVLFLFEEECPDDERPRAAINAAQDWIDGKISAEECRELGLAAHEAAKTTANKSAIASARAAGYTALATYQMDNARVAALNATKAVYLCSNNPNDLSDEQEWQLDHLTTLHNRKEKSNNHWRKLLKH